MYEVNLYEETYVMVTFLCFCDEHMKVNVKLVPVHKVAQRHEGTLGPHIFCLVLGGNFVIFISCTFYSPVSMQQDANMQKAKGVLYVLNFLFINRP
jgi:hypothetical protein